MPTSGSRRRAGITAALMGSAALAWTATGCPDESAHSVTPPRGAGPESHETPEGRVAWFEGGVDAAFARARAEERPVFLYWGAQWCPPCHRIKREVFTHPRFAELVDQVVPVYLDGDTPEAQRWGEAFGASGYPTLLLLAPDRRELMRFSGVTNFAEFAAAFEAALTASRPVAETLRMALDGTADADDWRLLAELSWMQDPRVDLEGEARLAARKALADRVPSTLPEASASLSGSLLAAVAAAPADVASPTARAVRAEPRLYLSRLLAGGDASFAARAYVLDAAVPILEMLGDPFRSELAKRWNRVILEIAEHPRATKDLELEAVLTELEIDQLIAPDVPPGADLVRRAKAAVDAAVRGATSHHDRHAVISLAAHVLGRVGHFDAARDLLRREIERTDTPWYYQSSLSRLELDAGDPEAALAWAGRAAASAEGRATRVQWTVEHLTTAIDVGARGRVAELLDAYYEVAFALPDGFSGRNWRRAQTVADAVRPLMDRADVSAVLERRAGRCAELGAPASERCRTHFAALGSSG
jgi:thiol-disulfide isomerase/thioredoxin